MGEKVVSTRRIIRANIDAASWDEVVLLFHQVGAGILLQLFHRLMRKLHRDGADWEAYA